MVGTFKVEFSLQSQSHLCICLKIIQGKLGNEVAPMKAIGRCLAMEECE